MKQSAKRRRGFPDASVDDKISCLREKHGQQYTGIQYRLWAEMLDVGTHESFDDPPSVPMFTGNRVSSKKVSVADAMSDLTSAISSVIAIRSPGPTANASATVNNAFESNADKKAQLRSQYLQQLKELHGLFQIGALDADEMADLKKDILKELKNLK